MATKRLKRVGLCPETLERCQRQHILTCSDFLSKTRLELLKHLNINDENIKHVILQVSRAVVPKPVTAYELWSAKKKHFLPLSLPELDQVLHGGIPLGTITEIAGPAGCGKTQFSIMLSVLATVPVEMGGLGGAVVYIDTESAFSAERLVEVAQNRFPGHFISEESLLQLTSRVHVYHESTSSQLLKRLQTLEEDIIEKKVKLIILDSVASLVRKEFDSRTSQNLYERTNLLAKEAAILKYLAESFYIPVVVTNQITTRFGFNLSEVDVMEKEDSVTSSENGYVTAALGNTWSHSVNTRLIIQYLDDRYRQILIAKSPVAPFAAHEYDIQDNGIVLKCNGARQYEGTDPGLQQIRVRTSLQKECFPT